MPTDAEKDEVEYVSSIEKLRLLVALIHPVRDSRATLLCHNGQRIDVGHHPAAELSPCQLRSVVIASGRPCRSDYTELVAGAHVHGSLEPMGGGLHRRLDPVQGEQRWFSTLLPPTMASEMLDRVDIDAPEDAFEATMHPDDAIGATSVCIAANNPYVVPTLDEISFQILAICLAEELVLQARQLQL